MQLDTICKGSGEGEQVVEKYAEGNAHVFVPIRERQEQSPGWGWWNAEDEQMQCYLTFPNTYCILDSH